MGMRIAELRKHYHNRVFHEIIRIRGAGHPNFADSGNRSSVEIAWQIVRLLGSDPSHETLTEQSAGKLFEKVTCDFLEETFERLQHLRPGKWLYRVETAISSFDQYEHLARLQLILSENEELASALGSDYIVTPDIVIARSPVSDEEINLHEPLVGDAEDAVQFTPFRGRNQESPHPILHASISCKWTIRSDRAQNTRTEALNLIRNRKGPSPHIVAVTAEPLPTRLAALALGTGDLDCVYHFALPELQAAVNATENEDQLDMLNTLLEGRRLRDISDLPFDLAT